MTATITLRFTAFTTDLDDVDVDAGLRAARDVLGDRAALAHAHHVARLENRAHDEVLADLWDRAELSALDAACYGFAIQPSDVWLVAEAVGGV